MGLYFSSRGVMPGRVLPSRSSREGRFSFCEAKQIFEVHAVLIAIGLFAADQFVQRQIRNFPAFDCCFLGVREGFRVSHAASPSALPKSRVLLLAAPVFIVLARFEFHDKPSRFLDGRNPEGFGNKFARTLDGLLGCGGNA
jgi:hypothetical protein